MSSNGCPSKPKLTGPAGSPLRHPGFRKFPVGGLGANFSYSLNISCGIHSPAQPRMRLDIGPGGKIIGTKRVSPNGQVSGLSEYTGREVLIVLLEDASSAGASPVLGPSAWSEAINEQMHHAFEQYQALQEQYATPWEATRAFLQSVFPWAPIPDLKDQVHRWIEGQLSGSSRGGPSPSDGKGSRADSSTGPAKSKSGGDDVSKRSASHRGGKESA